MIPMAKPILDNSEVQAVIDVLRSGIIAQSLRVQGLEKGFAEYTGVKYAAATSSGTTALHTALLAHGIKRGDEVITTPFTFIATSNSILFCDAKPVFVDVEEKTFNINPDLISEKITNKTKAIIIVHLYGQPCDMKPITEICSDHNLILIEDACQAHGAEYEGKKVGNFGTGCFSFYPTKNIIAGEGGIITTDDERIADKSKMIRDHGSSKRYRHDFLGYNYRMTDMSAAIGIEQLKKLDQFNYKRIKNAEFLTSIINKIKGLIPPYIMPNVRHVFNQYTIRVTEEFGISRDELIQRLDKRGIETRVYYPIPIYKQSFYRKLGYNDNLIVSEMLAGEVLSLPVHPMLTNKDLETIAEALNV